MSEHSPTGLSFGDVSLNALLTTARAKLAPLVGRSWHEIERAVSARANNLVESNAHRAVDAPTQQWLQRSSLVLAAYQELEPLAGRVEVLSVLCEALTVPFKGGVSRYLAERFGVSDDAPHEAFVRISENFKKRGEDRFGQAFVYDEDVQDATRSFTNIRKCFFNDFFRANGAPELTSIFCALDKIWADALEEQRYGVRFDRPTTLAQGDDACRFQFSKKSAA